MKLVLTSCGVINAYLKEKILKLFDRGPKDIRMLYVTTAVGGESDDDLSWVREEFQTILDLGILKENIVKYKIGQDIDMNQFDVIYMMGGNTFYLMFKIRAYHFDKVLENAIHQGIVYIGSSVGSGIMGKTIDSALDFDLNLVGLQDFSGLGVVDAVIIPRANRKEFFVKEYQRKSLYPIVTLVDQNGIVLELEV